MATSHKYHNTETKRWSYGAEIEVVDWPNREPLAPGMAIDEGELHNVNSNGVAVDGTGKLYHLGGEILTAPSVEVEGPADQLAWVVNRWPEATCNFRTGLNIHVRVPGLRDDLKKLKQLQAYIHKVMPGLLPVIDPLPQPVEFDHPTSQAFQGAKRDYLRCRKNHYSLLSTKRLALQMEARTPKEFFEAEALHVPTGKVHWATVARACVNLRQLLQTDTVEFRHFPGSASPVEVYNATLWCRAFLEYAFDDGDEKKLLVLFGPSGKLWPKPSPYNHWLDTGFFYTSKHYHPPELVPARIEEWLANPKPAQARK